MQQVFISVFYLWSQPKGQCSDRMFTLIRQETPITLFLKLSLYTAHADIITTAQATRFNENRNYQRLNLTVKLSLTLAFVQPEGLAFEGGPGTVVAGAVSIFVMVWFGTRFPGKGWLRAVRASMKLSDSKTRKCGVLA